MIQFNHNYLYSWVFTLDRNVSVVKMSEFIANLKAVQDAAIAAAASQPGIDLSQVLLQIQAVMTKANDKVSEPDPEEPNDDYGDIEEHGHDYILELAHGYRGNSVNLVVNGGFKFSLRKAGRFPLVTWNCPKFKGKNKFKGENKT